MTIAAHVQNHFVYLFLYLLFILLANCPHRDLQVTDVDVNVDVNEIN